MNTQNYLSMDSSIIYRCNQKYYDKVLSQYDLNYTSMLLLMQIYEKENVSMNELVMLGAYDKGTITKAIQKLESSKYVKVSSSLEDKRSKLLSTTVKAQELLPKLYQLKADWVSFICSNLNPEEFESYINAQKKIVEKVREYQNTELVNNTVKIYGLQKLTLLDYPGHVAATIFTGGCNFRCPFCHNRSLVFLNENDAEIEQNDVVEFLKTRTKILDGVCITGGEPLLHSGLKDFIKEIKELGLKVKLDTNGSSYEKLKELVEEGLVDYVAMDIKNCPKNYLPTIGLTKYDLSEVEKVKNYLLEDHVDYEFRTTVVKQFHDVNKIVKIGEWINGAKRYYLQNFEDHGTCIEQGLEAVSKETLESMKDACKPYVKQIDIRGIKE